MYTSTRMDDLRYCERKQLGESETIIQRKTKDQLIFYRED